MFSAWSSSVQTSELPGFWYLHTPSRVMFSLLTQTKPPRYQGFQPIGRRTSRNVFAPRPLSCLRVSQGFFFRVIFSHLQKNLPFCTPSNQVARLSNWQELIFEPAAQINVLLGVELCSEYLMANPALSDVGEFY